MRTTVLDRLLVEGQCRSQPDLLIEVVQGDITKEQTDTIASSTTQFLDFKSGVSAALAEKGGDVIGEEANILLAERR